MADPLLRPALFSFLRELKDHNDRDWFKANKERYERDVKRPCQDFIVAMSGRLEAISEELVADPRKSMFRIYRDVRFSKDKSPYKTHAAVQFRHVAGKDAHAPGFYVHLEPGQVFLGAGTWHPGSDPLRAIREAIAEKPAAWREVRDHADFAGTWRLGGDSLKRAPRGFDGDHPEIEDIKRKDFIAVADLTEEDALAGDFPDRVAERFAAAEPFMAFLTGAIGVAW